MLAAYLRRSKLTQAEFARRAQMSPPMLSMVLTGRRLPGRDAALNIESASDGQVAARLWSKAAPRRAA